jgi:uroporphyrinogen decarboxylase
VVVKILKSAPALLAAANREPATHTPVWFMRQAGRYLPEYRAIRERHTLLEMCADPELAAEVTLQPVRRLGVDAAILFADILLPLVPMGLDLAFAPGEGPVIRNPVRRAEDVARLAPVDVADGLSTVFETVRTVRRALDDQIPVIGFAGAPFTVASYAIEGGSSRHFVEVKRFMYSAPSAWNALMERLVTVLGDYLAGQADAGAQVLQVFDSWAGILSPDDYRRYVLPYSKRLFDRLKTIGVPTIHFGADRAVQGNLDPVALFAPRQELEARVRDILRRADRRPGHIFNLGHGLLPTTPVDHVRAVVDLVHELTG